MVELVVEGYSNKLIADRLNVERPGTINQRVSRLMVKLGLNNRVEIARYYLAEAWNPNARQFNFAKAQVTVNGVVIGLLENIVVERRD